MLTVHSSFLILFSPDIYFLHFPFLFLESFPPHTLSPAIDSTHSIRELERKAFNPSCPAGEHFDLSHVALSFECISTHGARGKCFLERKAYEVLFFSLLCFFVLLSVYFVFAQARIHHK